VNGYAAVHQFHSGASVGDAVTQQMLRLQTELRAMGIVSEVLAEHVDPRLSDRIRPIQSYGGSDEHLLLLHHSMGNDAFDDVIGLPNDIVAIYHNITPEHYFADPGSRKYVRLGRAQLAALARRANFGVAASNFNRKEMLAVGFDRPEVLPVRTDFAEFAPTSATDRWRSTDWLFVGRIVGNKCQHELVRAFAVYARSFDTDARLVLVGDTSHGDYVDLVRADAARLGVAERVVLLGKISERQLISAFSGAGVYVSLSEHEGFGVPILEAMAAGVPVVAFGAAAVPETMGGAGIILGAKDPALVAATVQSIREDAGLRDRLVRRQFQRVDQVHAFDTRRFLARVIRRASGGQPPLEIQVQGPFETSYSLAQTNRNLALGLDRAPGCATSIFATEGPGDYEPHPDDLGRFPQATALFRRSAEVPYPHVAVRQMWPPRVTDSPGGITCQYFGWEESRVPAWMVDDFNRYLDGVGVTSRFVEDVLRDSGVDVPIRVVGNGVDRPDPDATVNAPELDPLRAFRFVNIGSAFPRKGIDVLLKAYFAEFDGSDDVSLVLKTFPNPHNDVGDMLKELRAHHPNPPDVRWIDRDLDERELQGLHNLASCYVHPARGEGFGLPVAEAMAAGVPVISLAYSGLADFVSDATAITIPFRIEAARTHLELSGSQWAEPDEGQLAVEMRRISEEPDSPRIRERVERAQDLIATHFTWDAAVERWVAFIDELEQAAETVRLAMVTTWNSRCGIAEYTHYLVDQSPASVEIEIFANTGVDIIDPDVEPSVTRCWANRWSPDLDELEEALNQSDAEVVHFQFNFGFFELKRLAALIDRQLERRGVVITFHRTKDVEIEGEMVSFSQIRSTLERVDRLIVHQASDARRLREMGFEDNVQIVAHGAASPSPVTSAQVRSVTGLGNRPVIGTFGFLLPHKGFMELLEVIDRLRIEFPDICLLAPCARHPDEDTGFEETVRARIDSLGLHANVVLVTDYLRDQTARAILAAADVIVLPYRQTEESASGALRFVLPVGRPIIATDLPIFADARDSALLIDPTDPTKLENAVRRVLTDSEFQRDLSERAAAAARRNRWSRIAADHREIYAAARTRRRRLSEWEPFGSLKPVDARAEHTVTS
jgi:glycosyltransferase involved in cell wall biosynthesis